MINSIYYLPGHGGRLTTGLGEALSQRGLAIIGRETVGEFLGLPFLEQVALVVADLRANFWSPNARVVANSFGAYLFLHAQASISPYPGRVLILSPIIGDFQNEGIGAFFSPPYPNLLGELAEAVIDCATAVGLDIDTDKTNERLIRYYQTEGVLDRPERYGRDSAYHFRHLIQVLNARRLVTNGLPLALAIQYNSTLSTDELETSLTAPLPNAAELLISKFK